MGTFKDSLKKWFYTEDSAPTVGDTTRIPLLDSTGEPIGSRTLQDLQDFTYPAMGNVVIVAARQHSTTALQTPTFHQLGSTIPSSLPVIGVAVIEGGRVLIIAKDRTTGINWGDGDGGTTKLYIGQKTEAIADFDGKTKTSTIYTTLGNDAPAAKYCLDYYPSNISSTHAGLGQSRWWLPSMGEVAMIVAHLSQINYALRSIGGTEIGEDIMSSTESSETSIWGYSSGYLLTWAITKTNSASREVRPVTSFYA